jgi:hypothetical protein
VAGLPQQPSELLEWLRTAITAISAATAIVSALIARKAIREQGVARERERRASSYDRIVLEPAARLLMDFEVSGVELIESRSQAIVSKCAGEDVQLSVVEAQVGAFVVEFKTQTDALFNRLFTLVNAWGKEDLRAKLREAISRVEDLSEQFPQLAVKKHSLQKDLAGQLRSGIAGVLNVIARYENFDS